MKIQRTTWQAWNHDRNEVFRIANYPNPVLDEMWFLTIDPFVGIPVFIANLSSDNPAGVFSRTFIVKNISNSLTYTVASSCSLHFSFGGYDYPWTARFRQSIYFSITQVLFADHVHWRYRSQQIFVPQVSTLMQAGSYFPKVGRMLFLHAPLILTHFWPASTLLRGHLALATLSSRDPSSIFWSIGATLMRFTWANISERRILVSNFGVTCNSLLWTSHVGLVSACLCSSGE